MGCKTCGQKNPLIRRNQMARHYTNPSAKRRTVGRVPVPASPTPEPELLPAPEVVEPQPQIEELPNETT